eukprot:SAG31_NODE_1892_length_6975_cov_7.974113_1_plen_742_part_00
MLSTSVFHFFSCREYDQEILHIFDYSVHCDSPEYRSYHMYAVCTVFVYPIGILLFFATLLHANRDRITRAESMFDHGKLDDRWWEGGAFKFRFMVAEYRTEYFWYEIFEYGRKLVYTFVLGFAAQGTATQNFAGLIISIGFLIFNCLSKPYKDYRVNVLRITADFQMCLTMAGCLMLRLDSEANICGSISRSAIGWFLVCTNILLTVLALCFESIRRATLMFVGNRGLCGVMYCPSNIIGRGAASIVYEGKWRPLKECFDSDRLGGHAVAVKSCSSCAGDALVMMKRIVHKNVRTPLTIVEGEKQIYYVASDLCSGSLADCLAVSSLPTDVSAMHFCRMVLDGLAEVHQAGILHGCLNPSNILLDGSIPKISGWGSARDVGDYFNIVKTSASESSENTCGDAVVNPLDPSLIVDLAAKPSSQTEFGNWLAPELLDHSLNSVTAESLFATDIFTLGLTILYILGGKDAIPDVLKGTISVHELKLPFLTEEAIDLIQSMIEVLPEKRAKMEDILEHPFWWPAEKKLDYLAGIADLLRPRTQRKSFAFVNALEEAIDSRLGGSFDEDKPDSSPSWARLLDSRYPLTGKWSGQTPPTLVEMYYHVFGTNPSAKELETRTKQRETGAARQAAMATRGIGLMKFVRNVGVAHRVQLTKTKQFESHEAVMQYILGPLPWLVVTVYRIDQALAGWRAQATAAMDRDSWNATKFKRAQAGRSSRASSAGQTRSKTPRQRERSGVISGLIA